MHECPVTLIDLRFSVISFFLIWGAVLMSLVGAIALVKSKPRYVTLTVAGLAVAMWVIGSVIGALTKSS